MYHNYYFKLLSLGVLSQTLVDHNIRRLVETTYKIIKALGVPEEEHSLLVTGTHMHDLGKLLIPGHILGKNASLTPEEREVVNSHPGIGAKIAEKLGFPELVLKMIGEHHENWDGSGYPRGLKREEISPAGRIMRIVDYFDAVQCKRPYHQPLNSKEAYSKIVAGSGTLFDPEIVSVLSKILAIH